MADDAGRCYRTRGTSIPTSNLIVNARGAGNTQGFYVSQIAHARYFYQIIFIQVFPRARR